jgi:anti-sigma-K factor RskA
MTHDELEGIAALDAIGAATVDEQTAFLSHADDCEYCLAAADEYAEAAALIGLQLQPVAPPPELRSRILSAVERGDDTIDTIDNTATTLTTRRMRVRPWSLATAATLFLALWIWREVGVRVLHERNASQNAEIARLEEENTALKLQRDKVSGDLAAITNAHTHVFALAGQRISPSASARAYLVPDEHRALVVFSNLPANPSDRSYQLWIIRADKPKPDAGPAFDVNSSGFATVNIDNLPVGVEIKGLAVTMEPRGGVPQSTNGTFYVLGKT